MLLKEHKFLKQNCYLFPPFVDPIKCLQMLDGFY